MANRLVHYTQSLGRLLLGFLALCLTLVIMAQIALIAASLWLGTQGGQQWMESRINQAAAPAGATVRFSRLGYDAQYGLYVRDLLIAGSDGSMIEADRARIDIALIPLITGNLHVTATAGTMIIHPSLPITDDDVEEPRQTLQGFTLPDFFITNVAINRLAIRELHLRHSDPEQTLILAPSLEAAIIRQGSQLDWRSRLTIGQPDKVLAAIPHLVIMDGALDTQSLSLRLSRLDVQAQAYDITAQGAASWPLAGEGEAIIRLPALEDRGLAPITLNFNAQDQNGFLSLESAYRDLPVTLTSAISLGETTISVTDIALQAPDLTGEGALSVDRTSFLADGALSVKADNLAHYAALADMALRGRGRIDAVLKPAGAAQALTLNTDLSDIGYEDITVEQLALHAGLADISYPLPDNLTLDARGLRVDAQTHIARLQATLSPQGHYHRLQVTARGQSRLPFSIEAAGDLHDLFTDAPSARNINATLAARRSSLIITGQADRQALDITARTDGIPLGIIPGDLPDIISRLSLSGEARLHGPMDNPVATADIALSPLRIGGADADLRLTFTGLYQNGNTAITMRGSGTGINRMQGAADFPMHLSLLPFAADMPQTTPLEGDLSADMDIAALAALFLPPDHRITGALTANANIDGTLFAPAMNGALALSNGSYLYEPYGLSLNDLTMQAGLSGQHIILENISAHDGAQGTINADGRYGLTDGEGMFNLAIGQYHLFRGDMLDGRVDGTLSARAADHGFTINGDLAVGPMSVTIPEQFQTDIPELNIVEAGQEESTASPLESVALDISLTAERLFVRGWGLDAEFEGMVDMDGTLADPQFNGTMSAERGRYEEFGRRFDLAKADMRFQGSIPPSPYLDIEATTRAGAVTAAVHLTGSVSNPSIGFSSTPALPEDEVLAYILFGRAMSRITPFQAVQLTQTLRRFSGEGGGGFDPLGTIRSLTGLDDIRVDTDEEGATSVGAGKYLSDNVYLEVESGAGEAGGAATLQIELTPNITVESEVGQDAQAGGGIFWRYDY